MKLALLVGITTLIPFVAGGFLRGEEGLRRKLDADCPPGYNYAGKTIDTCAQNSGDGCCKNPNAEVFHEDTVCCILVCKGLGQDDCNAKSRIVTNGPRPCMWKKGKCQVNPVAKGLTQRNRSNKGHDCSEYNGDEEECKGTSWCKWHEKNEKCLKKDQGGDKCPLPDYDYACGRFKGDSSDEEDDWCSNFRGEGCKYNDATEFCCHPSS